MAQHASLTLERWSAFSFDQQILMIANEMHRAGKLVAPDDAARRASAYERVLRLTDLTIQTRVRWGARRELLRWRDLAARSTFSRRRTRWSTRRRCAACCGSPPRRRGS